MNNKFHSTGFYILHKDDFKRLYKIILKNNVSVQSIDNTLLIGSDGIKDNFKNIKLDFDRDFTMMKIILVESDNYEISNIIKNSGFKGYYLGDDGSWLANPYYLIFGDKTSAIINRAIKGGMFSKLAGSLWNFETKSS